jgi:tetratricopeptide (TPR) repeat protein
LPLLNLSLLAVWIAGSPLEGQAVPDEVAALVAAGGQAFEAGDLDAAEQRFSQALAAEPRSALAWFGLSEVFERRGATLEALRHAREAERLAPDEPVVVFAVSRHLIRLGRVEEALESLARFRVLEPQRPEGYLVAAALLRRAGEVEEAAALLESGYSLGVRDPRLSEELALVLLMDGEVERARQAAEEGLKRFAEDGGLLAAMGMALAADPERRGEAGEWLESALETGIPSPARIHLELATLLLEQGETVSALENLRSAAELEPNSPQVHYRLAGALRTAGDREGAAKALERYQELTQAAQQASGTQTDVATLFNEAQSLAGENRLPEALEVLATLLAQEPRQDRALALKGKVLLSLGEREEALGAFVAARQVAEGQVEYHYLEGLTLLQLGRAAAAEAPLRRALTLDDQLAEGYALLGMMLSSQERYPEAIEQFEQALALGAEGAGLRLGFAEALRGAGRGEESAQQMEAYRRLSEG